MYNKHKVLSSDGFRFCSIAVVDNTVMTVLVSTDPIALVIQVGKRSGTELNVYVFRTCRQNNIATYVMQRILQLFQTDPTLFWLVIVHASIIPPISKRFRFEGIHLTSVKGFAGF